MSGTARRTGRLAAYALAGLLAAGATGCDSSSSGATAAPSHASVALADLAARELAAMTAAGSAHVRSSSPTSDLSGDISYGAHGQSLALSGTSLGAPVDVVYSGGILYLGGMEDSTVGGEHWIKIDPAAPDSLSRSLSPLLKTFDQLQNPVSVYAKIPGLRASVTSTDSGGTGYETRVTAAQLAQMSGQTPTADPSASPGASPGADGGVTLRQTVDAKGRLVHVEVLIAGTTLSYDYSDWGAPVSITVPKPGEIGVPGE